MNDKIVICLKCGGPMCYEIQHENVKSWMCMGCGFQTNSFLKEGSDFQIQQEETLPELYKDLKYVDLENKAWYPIVLNFPERGMVFADGASKNSWGWTSILATKILEEEKKNYKKPGTKDQYYEYKMDNKTKKHFESNDFISAAAHIKLFEDE